MDAAASKSRVDRTFGQFVRVLIDMDLTRTLNHNVLVEREGFAFFSDIEYENLPEFCTHCRKSGHVVQNCKLLRPPMNSHAPKPQEPALLNKSPTESDHADSVHLEARADDGDFGGNNSDNTLKKQDLVNDVPEAEALLNGLAVDDPVLVPVNSLNFVTHPSRNNDSQLSEFVDATQFDVAKADEGAVFLQKSWDNLAEEDEPIEGAFSNAISNLNKKKHTTRVKKKHSSRSQAGPKTVSS
ncbi:uncharacterized protein LOC131640837 [Vicia villosa]|uniref:uncharacterized protein LOC131640837 n=1 Tax=Vicia villosa TaxID=3911 RepID=UPI00273BE3FA|nr:uncharacterized protein LOC131640837 [Vicia villosa]